ncbi:MULTISPECIES: ATP-dependent DNA helicase RecQ [Sporosarcina]|uniref:RecQ family ATP-dependent DNA helicase n=1 Tax=Sporosarcina contaminans TaxID=633403 RepID=A0ABW3U1A3_9BACL
MIELYETLKKRFGYEKFRPGQKEVIQHILSGKDTIAILPTGMGKSLCYQLPGYLLEGSVVIVSPLVSLMEDQAAQMRKNGEKSVIALNSFLSFQERKIALQNLGQYKFIFVSPEMLLQERVANKLRSMKLSIIVVDEAHCVSQWGFDFRPDYLRIGKLIDFDGRPPILSLTATAQSQVIEEISDYLHMDNPVVERHSLDRQNISYCIIQLNTYDEKYDWIKERVTATTGPGIIYASSRKRADELSTELQSIGVAVQAYHAGKENEDRAIIQEQFINGEIEWICATNAFGMGIHKGDIRQVIHEHMPSNMNAYVQEVGRAGRDGKPAAATLLYVPRDEDMTRFIVQNDLPAEEQIMHYAYLLSEGVNDDEAADRASLGETAKRVLDFYMEQFSIDKVLHIVDRLAKQKDSEVHEMVQLITGQRCIRESLMSYFDEKLDSKREYCCSVCGLPNAVWLSSNQRLVERHSKRARSWDERILSLL